MVPPGMKGLPSRWSPTTCVSTRFGNGNRRDSSAGLAAAVLAGSEAGGFGSGPQEIRSAAAASSGRAGMRNRPQYNAGEARSRGHLPNSGDLVLPDLAVRRRETHAFRPGLGDQHPVEWIAVDRRQFKQFGNMF